MSHHYDYSGDRIYVDYEITGDQQLALSKAKAICVEQTIEFPPELVFSEEIKEHVIGRLENLELAGDELYRAEISYAVEVTGYDLTQLINVLFGNTGLKPGIRLASLRMPNILLAAFRGPRFGITGMRELLNVHSRPLLCAALKPMGLTSAELAKIAFDYAAGGIDLIKEDHGFANQPFSPFEERVERCAEAVARANQQTGNNCIYLPNIPGPVLKIVEHAHYAKQAGAGGLLVSPGLLGYDAMRTLADENDVALPILCHPALLGSHTAGTDHGISHYVLYGILPRLAGADMVIFPVFGGRFSFSPAQCRQIVDGCSTDLGSIKPIFPVPAGGMRIDRVPEMIEFFDKDSILLIGGNLQRGGTPAENSARFLETVLKAVI